LLFTTPIALDTVFEEPTDATRVSARNVVGKVAAVVLTRTMPTLL